MKIFRTEPDFASFIALIRNAGEYVIIVSPFNDLAGSERIKEAINEASKKIRIEYYVRQGQAAKGIEDLNVSIFEVPGLHAKAFFSEHQAMISSGNLDVRPDINCTLLLDKKEEYDSIVNFFEKFIRPVAIPSTKI